jgi:hypothetical protein
MHYPLTAQEYPNSITQVKPTLQRRYMLSTRQHITRNPVLTLGSLQISLQPNGFFLNVRYCLSLRLLLTPLVDLWKKDYDTDSQGEGFTMLFMLPIITSLSLV